MGNRVEKLERQVAELRATVDGLTEELVETKERVNELEGDTEPTTTRSADEDQTAATSHAEFVPNQSADDHAAAADEEPASGQSADEEPADDSQRTDDDDGDDIIVA